MNDDLMKVVVNIVELIISGGLVVLIWIIQILHYPSFRFVHRDVFKEFEAFHTLRISLIVMPLMIAELALVVVNFR